MTKKSKKDFVLCQRCKLDTSMVSVLQIALFAVPRNAGPFCWFCSHKLGENWFYTGAKPKELPYNYRIRELIKQADKKEVDLMKLQQEGKIPFEIFEIMSRIKYHLSM